MHFVIYTTYTNVEFNYKNAQITITQNINMDIKFMTRYNTSNILNTS